MLNNPIGWYADFRDEENKIIVVFSDGKIFEWGLNDRATRENAISHGLSIGIV